MMQSLGFVVAAVVCAVSAQQPVWGQCGGIGYSGSITCASGSYCVKQNDWYSQCLPGTAAPSATPPASSSTKPSSSSSSSTKPASSTSSAGPVPTGGPNYWFSFGDSYTQTGFDPLSTLPTPGNSFGNPPYPGWTSANGENWIDFATAKNNKSLVLTYNYAYGGATIDANLVKPYTPTVLSLTDQVKQFLDGAAKKPASTQWTSANSLFSIWIGINDIGNSWWTDNGTTAGARNFLFLNVPPVDRSPMMIAQGADTQAAEKIVIDRFNSKLATRTSSFKSSHAGVATWIWDSNALFTKIINSPATYGFTDVTSYGTSAGYFWLNDLHPTSPAHKLFADGIKTLIASTIW
ncbi:hypothetical protein HGRIS_001777 [Hohenbuehelia grisea]|uniref:CBM1 domain-containing protein n=1 Tax=Hohenbuehelia grisea TaxID=104357 RepID=A0ABR3JK71_9AGAR